MAEHDDDSINLALLAHDLRTPLGAMRLTAELIEQGPLTAEQKDQLAVLVRSIDALNQMTSELIADLAPEKQDQAAFTTIASIVADCSDLFRVSAQSRGLKLDVNQDKAAAQAQTRQGVQLRRVLSALLDNAIKYTEAGRVVVDIACCPAPADVNASLDIADPQEGACLWVSIAVTDTGPGIDPAEREALFRPFVRGKDARSRAPGTGLGLWGTAQAIHQMGGKFLHSDPQTGGSRFELQIPAEEAPDGSPAGDDCSTEQKTSALPGHVLIVDDNETNCRLLSALLESFGVSTDVAGSGEQAVSLVKKADYDAVLLDLHMPGMSGIETAVEIRTMFSSQELPLIAVTAALESVGDKRLRQSGFQEVLTKPLSPSALHSALELARKTKNMHLV